MDASQIEEEIESGEEEISPLARKKAPGTLESGIGITAIIFLGAVMKNAMILSTLLAFSGALYADWLDDLVALVGSSKEWKAQEAEQVVNKYIDEDKAEIERIEKKIQSKKTGFWAAFHYTAYKTELFTAQSQKNYHEKLLKGLQALPENKKDRQNLVNRLVSLYEQEQALTEFKKKLSEAHSISERIKLAAFIAAKQTQVTTKRSIIKGLFVF